MVVAAAGVVSAVAKVVVTPVVLGVVMVYGADNMKTIYAQNYLWATLLC